VETRLLGERLPEAVRPRLRQVLEEDGVLFTRYALTRVPAAPRVAGGG